MSVVLVTGASGFLGRHAVAALLDAGMTVHALARHPVEDLPALWHRADLLGSDSWEALLEEVRPSHLLHLAWETRHGYFWDAPENLDWLALSLRLVRLFHSLGGERAVIAGSCAEYDWSRAASAGGKCEEFSTPLAPATLYGTAKLAGYLTLSRFAEEVGLSLAWARLFLLYGVDEAPARLVPYMIRRLEAGEKVSLGNGARVRDFMDSRDAGGALAEVLVSQVPGPINIASGHAISFYDLAALLSRLTGAAQELISFEAVRPSVRDPQILTADVSRLTNEVGYRPRIGLEEGLKAALEWWRRCQHERRQGMLRP